MSRATGFVWDAAGEQVGWAMYCGTSDVMWSRIYPSMDAAWDGYRQGSADGADWYEVTHRECTCGAEPTEGFIGTDYGGLHHWRGTFCLPCGAIIGPHTFDERWDVDECEDRRGAPAPVRFVYGDTDGNRIESDQPIE